MPSDPSSAPAPNQNESTNFEDINPSYWRDLVDFTKLCRDEPPIGDFRKLQIMNLVHLFNQLTYMKGKVEHTKTADPRLMSDLQRILHQYADAIRDYKSLSTLDDLPDYAKDMRISLEGKFPYLADPYTNQPNRPYDTRYRTTKPKKPQQRDPIREMLRRILPNRLSWPEEERKLRRPEYGTGQRPETYSRFLDSMARFIIGTMGGCALIVPMIVMSLDASLTKSLVVVSVSVVLFALIAGMMFEMQNKDTIVATATYAAVLVVFVGNSGGNSGDLKTASAT